MANDNNQLALIITEQDKSSGEVIHLVPNSKQSIQPKSLLRLGVLCSDSQGWQRPYGTRSCHRCND